MSEKNIAKNNAFGYQLLLDLYNCRAGVCDDLSHCYQFLDEIVGRLGMTKQSPPSIFRSPEEQFPDKAGLSGWVPLIESSVVIHTLSQTDFISIDIYCCKGFDVAFAKDFCKKYFSPKRMAVQYIERGKDYYKTETNYHKMTVKKTGAAHPRVELTSKEPAYSG